MQRLFPPAGIGDLSPPSAARRPKARLIATLKAAGVGTARIRQPRSALCPHAAARLDAASRARGARCARPGAAGSRMRRAEATIEFAVAAARTALAPGPWRRTRTRSSSKRRDLAICRRSGAAPSRPRRRACGDEGPVELGKLEMLYDSAARIAALRRTLAGALVSLGVTRLDRRARPAAPHDGKAPNPQPPLYEISRINTLPCSRLPLAGRGPAPTLAEDTDVKPPRFVRHLNRRTPAATGRGHAMNANLRNFALWVIIVLLLLALFTLFQNPGPAHHLARHFLLAIAHRGRSGPRA
jgi:hypothetical protein